MQISTANFLDNFLNNKSAVNISSEKLKFSLFTGFHWYDVLLKNDNQDTIIYFPQVSFIPFDLSMSKFKRIEINDAVFFNTIKENKFNLNDFLLFSTSFLDSSFSKRLKIEELRLDNASVKVLKNSKSISFLSVDLSINSFDLGAQIKFFLNHLNWKMNNGKRHELANSYIKFNKNVISSNGLKWKYGDSMVDIDINMSKDSSFVNIHHMGIDSDDMKDYFPSWPSHSKMYLSSILHLNTDSLWLENLFVNSQNGSEFQGDLCVKNWTDFKELSYQIRSKKINLNINEWKWIEPIIKNQFSLSSIGNIESSFILKGDILDANVDVSIHTDIGNIQSSFVLSQFHSNSPPKYVGNIVLDHFNLGLFLNNENFNLIDGRIDFDAQGINSVDFFADINGSMSFVEFHNYRYKDIFFDGKLKSNYFKGKSQIRDDKVNVDFLGELDYSLNIPKLDFVADVYNLDLVKLNFPVRDSIANFSGLLEMQFSGNNWTNFEGKISAFETNIETYKKDYHFEEIFYILKRNHKSAHHQFLSNFMNVSFEGEIDFYHLKSSLFNFASNHLPFIDNSPYVFQNFNFDIRIFNSSIIKEFIPYKIDFADGTIISGVFNNNISDFKFDFESPNLRWQDFLLKNVKFNSEASLDLWALNFMGLNMTHKNNIFAKNIEYNHIGKFGEFRYMLDWLSSDTIQSRGIVKGVAMIDKNYLDLKIDSSFFYFSDTLWSIQDNSYCHFDIDNFYAQIFLNTKSQNIKFDWKAINGDYSSSLIFNDFELINLDPWFSASNSIIEGQLNGQLSYKYFDEHILNANIISNNLMLNKLYFGDLQFDLTFDKVAQKHLINGVVDRQGQSCVSFSGIYPFNKNSNDINLDVEVFNFKIAHLNQYFSVFDKISGRGIGFFNFNGPIYQPKFQGDFIVDNLHLSIPYLNADFSAPGYSSFHLNDSQLNFKEIDFQSNDGDISIGKGLINGSIDHNYFSDFRLGLNLLADSMLALNTNSFSDHNYYGRALASGNVDVSGSFNNLQVTVNGIFEKGSTIFIPLNKDEHLEELTCVHFIQKGQSNSDSLLLNSKLINTNVGFLLDMNLELNEDTEVNVIFDETLGDKLKTKGKGFINLGINRINEPFMFGEYTMNGGEYLFTLQNFINKKFEIQQGSKFLWEGKPQTAQMDLNAIYRSTPSIEPLLSGVRSYEVECSILMNGNLLRPEIDFDIQIPNADDDIKRLLSDEINTDEKKTQQFLSLLVLNSFMSSQDIENTNVDYLSSTVSSGAEVLNNQFFNWSSQFSDRFDLGFKYYPNLDNSLNNKEFELLLNNMKVNDRITFNGNIGTQPTQSTTNIIGDFKVEYQISKDRKLRIIAFRSLDESPLRDSDENSYTKGLGLFYRDEFDDAKDLWYKFKRIFKRKKISNELFLLK